MLRRATGALSLLVCCMNVPDVYVLRGSGQKRGEDGFSSSFLLMDHMLIAWDEGRNTG